MDLGTIVGIVFGFAILFWAILSGSEMKYFIDIPSVMIVVFGAIAACMIAIPLAMYKNTMKFMIKAMKFQPPGFEKLITDLVSYAEIARRDGILSLESVTRKIDDPFIVRGIQMAVDGTDPELIEQIMETDLENMLDRHSNGQWVLGMLGKYTPAFGMIGTLVGLVAMLANMSDISSVGKGMAVALLTTLYGAVLSNVVFLPMVDKLSRRSAEETLRKTIIIKGVMAIQSGDNPRIVEQKLKAFLPPSQRGTSDKDAEKAA